MARGDIAPRGFYSVPHGDRTQCTRTQEAGSRKQGWNPTKPEVAACVRSGVKAAMGVLKDPEEAQDCAAEVLLTVVVRHAAGAELPDRLPAYVAGGSRKQACLQLRSRSAARIHFGLDADTWVDPRSDGQARASELPEGVPQFLADLPDQERLVLQTTADLGSPAEAARALGIPVGLVSNALHRVRKKARVVLASLLCALQPGGRGVTGRSAPRSGRTP